MKNVVTNLYSEYGRFIDSQRAIPLCIDCLKPVERRILLSVHEVAKQKFQKSAKVVGHVLGNYHPHGDACLEGNTKIYSLTEHKIFTLKYLVDNDITTVESIGYNEETHSIIKVMVKNIRITKTTDVLYEIIFEDDTKIRCTDNHRFFSNKNEGFIRADELRATDSILNCVKHNNQFSLINYLSVIKNINILKLEQEVPVYDFTVINYENVFIVTNYNASLKNMKFVCTHNSAYESLVSLVNRGLVQGQGEFGNVGLTDSPAAAMRYTEVKANPALESWIEDTLEFVPWEAIELEPEPLYLPSPIPIGLIGDGFITGIGFNITRSPRYKYKDLLLRLLYLLNNNLEEPIIIPNIKDCLVKEINNGDFNKILKVGEGEINIIPNLKQIDDSTLAILGRHPLLGEFNKFKNFNLKYEDENNIPYFECVDAWNYKSPTSVEIRVSPYRKKLSKDFIEQIINLISGKVNIRVNVVEDNLVKLKGIDYCILQSYNYWKDSYLKKLNRNLEKSKIDLREMNIIEIIKKFINLNNIEDISIEVNKFSNNKISKEEVVNICSRYRIKTLVEFKINKTEIQNKINGFSNTISNIDSFTIDLIKSKL